MRRHIIENSRPCGGRAGEVRKHELTSWLRQSGTHTEQPSEQESLSDVKRQKALGDARFACSDLKF
jgi:hypothetical protein